MKVWQTKGAPIRGDQEAAKLDGQLSACLLLDVSVSRHFTN